MEIKDRYLLECKKKYPERMKICCLYEENEIDSEWIGQFDGIKICAGRLKDQNLLHHKDIFEKAGSAGKIYFDRLGRRRRSSKCNGRIDRAVSGSSYCNRTFWNGHGRRLGKTDCPCKTSECFYRKRQDYMVIP